MSDNATTLVFAPEDVVYQQTELGRNFWISDDLVGKEYSTLFSAQLTKFGHAARTGSIAATDAGLTRKRSSPRSRIFSK